VAAGFSFRQPTPPKASGVCNCYFSISFSIYIQLILKLCIDSTRPSDWARIIPMVRQVKRYLFIGFGPLGTAWREHAASRVIELQLAEKSVSICNSESR
jgi:hypothetical protein